MIFLGIDPGLSGAVAWLDGAGWLVVKDCPTLAAGKGTRRTYDPAAMLEMLASLKPDVAVLENPNASAPRMNNMASASLGECIGLWRMALTALSIPYELVAPVSWKAKMGLIGKGKDGSRSKARELWPAHAALFALVKHDGRAEAALLAEHRRRIG